MHSNRPARSENSRSDVLPAVETRSASMQRVLARAGRLAPWPFTVIIQGESGTGKTRLARRIHELSPRAKMPFEAYSLANPDVELMSSELFGHERGGFTGASRNRMGVLRSANHGTVFFDEVGKCPPVVQRKLLQVLDSHSFRSVGADRMLAMDVRLIVAANEPLRELVHRGDISREFMARLGLAELHVPPLRERREDIMPLAKWFVARHAGEGPDGAKAPVPGISKPLERVLLDYAWPDNVRELRKLMQLLLALGAGDGELDVRHLEGGLERFLGRQLPKGMGTAVDRREIAVRMIERMGGVKAKAARALGWSEPTLYRVLRGSG